MKINFDNGGDSMSANIIALSDYHNFDILSTIKDSPIILISQKR